MADADLRPMTLGEVLDRTFKLYRNHFWLFAGITALPSGVLLILRLANSAWTVARTGRVIPGQLPTFGATSVVIGILTIVISSCFFMVMMAFAQSATIFAVSDIYLGGSAGLRESYKRVGTKGFRMFGLILLVGLSCGVGFLLLFVPGVILACRMAVSGPVCMLEDASAGRSIDRSFGLTKGHGFQIFVIFLLILLLYYVVALLFQLPFLFMLGVAVQAHRGLSFPLLLGMNIATFVSEVLIWPVATISMALMYYNLRVRKEAFDLQHQMATLGPNSTLGTPSAV
jgi:hypothetical protein